MGKIVVLDENTSNKIAAGEVIEKPASVVKELVENSIDAGADNISVEIKNGGITLIKVIDNGTGMEADDVEIAFERHATSKIRNSSDLEAISTLGFRGEALASIAAVSKVILTTRTKGNTDGMFIELHGGTAKEIKSTGCPVGTSFTVKDLFFNTPARYKFLKKDTTEAAYVSDVVNRIALGNPQISFKLVNNNSTVTHTPGNNDLQSVIFSIYGKETAKNISAVEYKDDKIRITGYAGKADTARANRSHQSIFINGRYIRSKTVTSAIDEAYKTFLMKNKFAFIVLNLEVNPLLVDVNVHPAKMEVRFSNEQDIFRSVFHAVNNALLSKNEFVEVKFGKKEENPFKINNGRLADNAYVQEGLSFSFDRNIIKETGQKTVSGDNSTSLEYISNKAENNVLNEESSNTDAACGVKETFAAEKEEKEYIKQSKPVKQHFSDVRIVGQVFGTYIVAQIGDEMLVIDQHAAHERILYERLKKHYENSDPVSQMLFNPVVVELTYQEIKFLEDKKDFFYKLGFTYESFGNNSIILRAIPYAEQESAIGEAFLEVIDRIMNTDKTNYSLVADEALYTIACKAAIKANKKLDAIEIESILKDLENIVNPYTCPHGRPTVLKFTKHELEKLFKRVL